MTNTVGDSSLKIRKAAVSDSAAVSTLLTALGYPTTIDNLTSRILTMVDSGEIILVAERTDRILGLLTVHLTPVIHRPNPVARITLLVVAEHARGEGIGQALVEAAEREALTCACSIVEIISNRRYEKAHAFYGRLGYELTSFKFKKLLPNPSKNE